jgi:SAM-dependent methyltransferase
MSEFNLLQSYPRAKRKSIGRVVTPEAKSIAEKLDFHYFDGDRKHGFGGYNYDGRWQAVAQTARERYNLTSNSKVLVDRSDKGFLIFDLKKLIPGITVFGTHPSEYSINHAMDGYGRYARIKGIEGGDLKLIEQKAQEAINPFLMKADLWSLPFKDDFFDTVISINNVCAYEDPKHRWAVSEIIRVSKNNGKNCYIQNDSWKNEHQRKLLREWSLLCKIFLNTKEWGKLYQEERYNGDWGFTIIE